MLKEIHNNYIVLIKQVLQCTVRLILILIVDPCDSSTNVKPKQTFKFITLIKSSPNNDYIAFLLLEKNQLYFEG